jgi:hypothetical protein
MDTQYLRAPGAGEGIKLGGLSLPGVVTSIEVRGQYEVEKKKVQGLSGTNKLGRGYNDAQVTITLEVLPGETTTTAQVKEIERVFKNAFGTAGKPKPVRVVNPLLDSKDVYSVLFVGFAVRQGNEDDSLPCTLELLEFEPLVRAAERKETRQVVTGPQALPTGETPGDGTSATTGTSASGQISLEERAFIAGLNTAFRVGNAVPNALGLPSNTPLPPHLADIVAGGPGSEKYISGPK